MNQAGALTALLDVLKVDEVVALLGSSLRKRYGLDKFNISTSVLRQQSKVDEHQ